jgi:hypothetical protein
MAAVKSQFVLLIPKDLKYLSGVAGERDWNFTPQNGHLHYLSRAKAE